MIGLVYKVCEATVIPSDSSNAIQGPREEGRLEGMRLEVRRRYDDGRDDGFEDGRSEGYEAGYAEGLEEGKAEGFHAGRTEGVASGRLAGFEEGKQVGFDEGFKEGYERGRREERAHALEAFDKFLDDENDRPRDSYISSVSFFYLR